MKIFSVVGIEPTTRSPAGTSTKLYENPSSYKLS